MTWTTASVFFPLGRLAEEFIRVYMDRYMHPVQTDPQYLDGVLVTQSPVESDTHVSMMSRDNDPLTRFRKASYFNWTVQPSPIYENGVLTGHVILAGWPETFLSDITNTPAEIAELFVGVEIMSEEPS